MSTPSAPVTETCPDCLKPTGLCVCAETPKLATRFHVLILQHPQEPDKELGSARLAHLSLPNSTLKVGLSWPNLAKALGRSSVQPGRWGVLYLGSGVKGAEGKPLAPRTPDEAVAWGKKGAPRLIWVNKKAEPLPPSSQKEPLEGIVILDGTWSQAKALWWRNPWLLKLRRAILQPSRPSLYGKLRKEPRRECLSTIESIAEALEALGEPAATGEELRKVFGKLLEKKKKKPTSSSSAATSASPA